MTYFNRPEVVVITGAGRAGLEASRAEVEEAGGQALVLH